MPSCKAEHRDFFFLSSALPPWFLSSALLVSCTDKAEKLFLPLRLRKLEEKMSRSHGFSFFFGQPRFFIVRLRAAVPKQISPCHSSSFTGRRTSSLQLVCSGPFHRQPPLVLRGRKHSWCDYFL